MNTKPAGIALLALLAAALCLNAAQTNSRRALQGSIPPGAFRAKMLRQMSGTNDLHLALSLPIRNQQVLDDTVRKLYDPASPYYHQWLTGAEFAELFGPTEQDVQKVVRFAQR